MPETVFEFSGITFGAQQATEFKRYVAREFYDAEVGLEKETEHLRICNRRTFAGHFAIAQHQFAGNARTCVKRSWQQIRSNPTDVYLIWLPVRGSVLIEQNGQGEWVREGGIALSYSSMPFRIECSPDAQQHHVSFQAMMPAHLLARLLPDPRRVCGTAFPAQTGASSVARSVLLALFEQADHLSRDLSVSLFSDAVEAVTETVRCVAPGSGMPADLRETRLKTLLNYMALHASDPDLTAVKAATNCGISTRYLHYLLKSDNRSFHETVWEQRLADACEQLTDPKLARRSIAQIGYTVGFKSGAHFSRSFRKRFGRSPREARQAALGPRRDPPAR